MRSWHTKPTKANSLREIPAIPVSFGGLGVDRANPDSRVQKQTANLDHQGPDSTPRPRGGSERLSFEDTVLTGLAPNGGLYIPESIPSLPSNWQEKWKSLSFVDLAVEVLSLYISEDEIPRDDLRKLKLNEKLFVLELFHGPTFAFKDVALQLLGNLTEGKLTVVGATSGDTGSAAIYGLRNKENISIFILHPKGRISPIQQAQMTTITDANVHNIAVKGTFDDCQDVVKALFGDKEFNEKHRLGAVNSINWARILAQTVYYFLSYFRRESILVPTGNFGDVLAGYYAKRMGLPTDKLIIATNSNDILARFWKTGKYERVELEAETAAAPASGISDGKDAVKETLSPAMDILVSSNFERLLWYLAYEAEGGTVDDACAMSNGRVEVPRKALELAKRDFIAERVSDDQTLSTIRRLYESEPSYIVDPHTAVGLTAAQITASESEYVAQEIRPVLRSCCQSLRSSAAFDFDRDVLPRKTQRVIDVESADVDLVKSVIESTVDMEQTKSSTGCV
ncbi:tryptophan synthase beta subunit-like PLP-dependent enzyme [Thelephora terrestris]|uniref:threonine synthase n=1 Tax=Thelephora terrestris TaxID=56493 RepID=A0A9P6H1K1_9AGAM|nr:tryptophan synthase beta subunit-like PLP-dependent enzyme [Thelephora terrestris]